MGPIALDDEPASREPQGGEVVACNRTGVTRNIGAHSRRSRQALHQRAKDCPGSGPEVENPPVFARRFRRMAEHRLDERLGGVTRIHNGGTDLEKRPPKIPMAGASRTRLARQLSPRDK